MTISSSELKKNMTLIIDGELFQVIEWQHRKPPKAPPTLTLRVKSIKNGNITEKKVQGNRPLILARTEKQQYQYLYGDSNEATFMDTTTYEQINLTLEFLGSTLDFIEEGQYLEFLMYENNPISIELPSSVVLEVKSSVEAVKGDTATNVTKEATLSTDLKIQVPLFINSGDKVKVDTRTREYIERVNN
tara:strand:+ start:5603 stop:6169 length:567 start_codon:yes stop_codon:yes gene_type:complete